MKIPNYIPPVAIQKSEGNQTTQILQFEDARLGIIPTGIRTFDVNIDGGFPSGSVILLLEDVGAGAREFIYTSIFNIAKMKINHDRIETKIGGFNDADQMNTTLMLPDKLCYVSVSKSKYDILNEVAHAFHKDFYYTIKNCLFFKELSDIYFSQSIARNFLISDKKRIIDLDLTHDTNMLDEISAFLNEHAKNNVVILDSFTELMLCDADYLSKEDILMFLKGIVSLSKSWNGLIYLILSANILEKQMQEIVADAVDGVLDFEWFDKGSVKMRRDLYISKFRGLMPRIEQNKIAKFETKITSDNGFEVSNVQKII